MHPVGTSLGVLDSWATIRKQDYFNNSWRVTLLHRIPQVIESSGFQGRSPWLDLAYRFARGCWPQRCFCYREFWCS